MSHAKANPTPWRTTGLAAAGLHSVVRFSAEKTGVHWVLFAVLPVFEKTDVADSRDLMNVLRNDVSAGEPVGYLLRLRNSHPMRVLACD